MIYRIRSESRANDLVQTLEIEAETSAECVIMYERLRRFESEESASHKKADRTS